MSRNRRTSIWLRQFSGVEPEAAFDLPSHKQFANVGSKSRSVGILGTSFLAALTARLLLGRKMSTAAVRWSFWTVAFLLGAIGTTVISRRVGDFVFTWPVSIFVAFQAAVFQIRLGKRRHDAALSALRSRLIAAAFVVCCIAYFLLCRRLSLVFEWVFRCAASPRRCRSLWPAHFALLPGAGGSPGKSP